MNGFHHALVWIDHSEAKVFRFTGDEKTEVDVTGPGNSKVNFKAFLDHFRPSVAARVCALETLDQPGADSLLALIRRYFTGDFQPQSTVPVVSPN